MKFRSVETDLFHADRQTDRKTDRQTDRQTVGWTDVTKLIVAPNDKWVPASKKWRVLKLRIGKQSPIWRVAANVLNNQ